MIASQIFRARISATSPSCSSTKSLRLGPRISSKGVRRALPDGEDISDAMKADLERYQKRSSMNNQANGISEKNSQANAPEGSSSLKETLDKILIADFFLVLFVLAWLGAGVAQAGFSGGSSFLLDAWYPLWPLLWQPAIGVLMLGALVSGGLNWLKSKSEGN